MDSEYDLKTRVTGLESLKIPRAGADCLVVIYAPVQSELGRRHVLDRPVTTIGRGRDNDIVLPSDCVSRRHVRLEHRPDGLFLIDLSSTNGTYVNGSKLSKPHRLEPGDVIRVGSTDLRYER